ncbi:MAG TPA: hypothetical protein VIG30_00725 [Ktedonobacterales bacterium]
MPAPPSWPLPRAWQRTSRRWPRALLVIAAILVVAGAVIATFAALNQAGLIGSLAPLRTAIAGHAVPTTPARPAPTHVLPTATPLPLPAVLAASPSFVHIPCPAAGMPASITLRDTGGRALSWRISSPPLLLLFSAYSGTLAPGASSTIQVRALLSQKSTRSLVFTSDGGSVTLSYKVGCH